MKNLQGKVAIITGAASGIGKELALQLSQAGAKVALVDFNSQTLQETENLIRAQQGACKSYIVDVSKREEVYALSESVLKDFEAVDILINNAGVALERVEIEKVSYEDFEWLLGINMWGLIYGTKAFLPHLKTRNEAYIVNLSSVFGLVGIAEQGAYCVSKFAVRGFTQALRAELKLNNSNVKVMNVHPGGIKTNIAANARSRYSSEEEHQWLAQRFTEQAKTTAPEAAQKIIKAMQKGKERLLIGKDARQIDRIARLFPSKSVKIINDYIQKLLR